MGALWGGQSASDAVRCWLLLCWLCYSGVLWRHTGQRCSKAAAAAAAWLGHAGGFFGSAWCTMRAQQQRLCTNDRQGWLWPAVRVVLRCEAEACPVRVVCLATDSSGHAEVYFALLLCMHKTCVEVWKCTT